MSSNNLPPVRYLPHWTRVGLLEKPCLLRRLPANPDQQLPLPAVKPAGAAASEAAETSCQSGGADPLVVSLQRNIQFLQQQHKETLEKLHAEIEYLRRENKELKYKLIMEPPKSSRKVAHSQRDFKPPTQGSEAHSGLYLEEPLRDTRPLQDQSLSIWAHTEILDSARQDHGTEMKGHLIASLQPLRIHSSSSNPPRAPTLHECEVIIRQLYNANGLQSQEIIRVKTLLRDIFSSKKITPENYVMAKAYLSDGTRTFLEENKLPKLGLQSFPEKKYGPSQSGVVLPALKQSLSSTIAERQRRSHAVQRDRFRRTVR